MRLFLSMFALGLLLILLFSFSPIRLLGNGQFNDRIQENSSGFDFVVLKNDTNAWYYQVLKRNKVLIIQKNIPAITGNRAFVDSIQAAKVATLVLSKLENGDFPPSVQVSELNSLQIIY